MTVSLVAAAAVTIAAAVMVRRFYPDRIVMHHEAHGHGPAAATEAPAAATAAPVVEAGAGANGHHGDGGAGEPRPLEGVGGER
jgi:hypothetical protein